jgi:CRISPR-associated endonuclease/helicase Cas3
MEGASYFRYWGKADPAVGGHHLAVFHCLDVAAVAAVLLDRSPLLQRKFAALLSTPSDQVVPTLCCLIALHDFGKLDWRFQVKARDQAERLNSSWTGLRSEGYDHGGEGYRQFLQLMKSQEATFRRLVGRDSLPLLRAVCGHHGTLPLARAPQQRTVQVGKAPLTEADQTARSEWLEAVIGLFRERGAAMPWSGEASQVAVELLAGFCSICDWFGSQVSSETAAYFTYAEDARPLGDYFEHARRTAARMLDDVPIVGATPSGAGFAELFDGFEPRDVQVVTEALALGEGPALVVVEARMGSGKTEAALSLASRMMARGDASGVYIALPTMATSNGMFTRIRSVAPKLFRGEVNLRLAHGRARSNDSFDALIRRPIRGRLSDVETEADVVCARWFLSRKRALLGQLGVGTVDQAMQGAIKVRHNFVRLHGLATSVVIVDELHAYDAYMEVILERLVEWLGALQTPVILLSATLPAERRRFFATAYARGAGWDLPAPIPDPDPEAAPYPLVTVASRDGVRALASEALATPFPVGVTVTHAAEPEDDVLPQLLDAVTRGARVVWIRNTVTQAQAAWETACSLAPDARVLLFHARMRGGDRQRVERAVLDRFGRNGPAEGALLIATQVVEQSLDLDFDWMVTDLAPIDLMLQRVGRLHRHQRPRPQGFATPRLLVVAPAPEAVAALRFGPSAYVYDRVTLFLSLDAIASSETLRLPEQIRPLVEATYDPDLRRARIAASPRATELQACELKHRDELAAKRSKARDVCIAPTTYDPAGALESFDDDDESVQALTRDGRSTTLLLVHWEAGDEEGRSLDDDAPWPLDPEAPTAWRLAQRLHDETVSVPAYPGEDLSGATGAREAWCWEEWREKLERFLDAMGMRGLVIVPMRAAGGDEYSGRVVSDRSGPKRLRYGRERGLWFLKE